MLPSFHVGLDHPESQRHSLSLGGLMTTLEIKLAEALKQLLREAENNMTMTIATHNKAKVALAIFDGKSAEVQKE